MIIIATRIILVLIGIGALISMFCLGRWVEYRSHLESNEFSDKVYSKCLQLNHKNAYLKDRLGLNNSTKDDMGGK